MINEINGYHKFFHFEIMRPNQIEVERLMRSIFSTTFLFEMAEL